MFQNPTNTAVSGVYKIDELKIHRPRSGQIKPLQHRKSCIVLYFTLTYLTYTKLDYVQYLAGPDCDL